MLAWILALAAVGAGTAESAVDPGDLGACAPTSGGGTCADDQDDHALLALRAARLSANASATVWRQTTPEGFQKWTLESDSGQTRTYYVYVPEGGGKIKGMVLFLHGYTVSIDHTCGGDSANAFSAKAQADQKGFIAVCPEGYYKKDTMTRFGRKQFGPDRVGWNAGGGCCGVAALLKINDVKFVSNVLDRLEDTVLPTMGVAYPRQNVFAFGFSTGGLFAYRLSCELTDRFDGIASVGAQWDYAFGFGGDIHWTKPSLCAGLSVWDGIGSNDNFLVESNMDPGDKWGAYSTDVLHCAGEPKAVPAAKGVECKAYERCGTAGASESELKRSELCVYEGATHEVKAMRTASYGVTDTAWDFLYEAR